jgi:hypothetical protein
MDYENVEVIHETDTETQNKFRCFVCRVTFETLDSMNDHMVIHHSSSLSNMPVLPAIRLFATVEYYNVGTMDLQCNYCQAWNFADESLKGSKKDKVQGKLHASTQRTSIWQKRQPSKLKMPEPEN